MALTISNPYLDDLARKRAQAEALRQGMQQATASGIGVLQGVEARDARAATDKRDYEMRLEDITADNTRADASDRESIRQFNVENAARVNRETAAGQRQTGLDADNRANDQRDYALRLAPIQASQQERDRAAKAQAVEQYVATLDGGRIDRNEAAKVAAQLGVTDVQVLAAANAAATARSEKNAATDLNTRKTEAQIAVDEANAARLRRPPATKAPASAVPKARAMSDAGVKNFANVDNQIGTLRSLVAKKDAINLGPVDTRINDVAQMVGLDDPETTRFRADVGGVIDAIISDLSGASVPKAEWDRLKAGLPSTNDNDSAYKTKLESTLARIEGIRSNLATGYRASGRPVPLSTQERTAPIVGEASALGTTGVPDDLASSLDAMTPEDLDSLTPEQLQAILDAGGG